MFTYLILTSKVFNFNCNIKPVPIKISNKTKIYNVSKKTEKGNVYSSTQRYFQYKFEDGMF